MSAGKILQLFRLPYISLLLDKRVCRPYINLVFNMVTMPHYSNDLRCGFKFPALSDERLSLSRVVISPRRQRVCGESTIGVQV